MASTEPAAAIAPGLYQSGARVLRTWLFRLAREAAKAEALAPAIEGLPFWTVGWTGGGGQTRQRLADAVLLEDWSRADALWWELVQEAIEENFQMLRAGEDGHMPSVDPLDDVAEAEELVLRHIQAEQPGLLEPEIAA